MKALVIAVGLLIYTTANADYLYCVSTPEGTKSPPLTISGKGSIVAVIPQVRTAVWSLFEVWGVTAAKPTSAYHATVLKQPFTTGKVLWTVKSSSDLWFKYLTLWAQQDATVQGPIRLYDVQKLTQAQCQAVASRTLVGVTSDAGTLQPPPPVTTCEDRRDAGVQCTTTKPAWPDGSVLRCGTAGYHLRQWRFGGGLKEDDPNPGTVNAEPTGSVSKPPPVGIAADAWDVPPEPTTKQCTVPVSQVCP